MSRLLMLLTVASLLGCANLSSKAGQPYADQAPGTWVKRLDARPEADVQTVPRLSYESSLAYDPLHRKIVMWGGHGLRYDSPQLDETWLIDPATMKVEQASPARRPVGSCCVREMAFDSAAGLALQFEGHSTNHGWQIRRRVLLRFSIPWAFDVADGQWTPMRPWPAPPGGDEPFKGWAYSGLAYSPDHNVTVLFSGEQRPNDTWLYDAHTNTWTQTHPEPSPKKRLQAGFCYDPAHKVFVLLGGSKWDNLGDTWTYDPAAGKWTELQTRQAPPPGVSPVLSYDAAARAVLAFHSARVDGKLVVKIWQLDLDAPTWRDVTPPGDCPQYSEFAISYVPELNVHVVGPGHALPRGYPTSRQWWTYRHAAGPVADPGPIVDADWSVAATRQGVAIAVDPKLAGSELHRAVGPQTWTLQWQKLADRVGQTVIDQDARDGRVYHYRLKIGDRFTTPKRAQPRAPGLPVVAPMTARRVEVSWTPSKARDVVGYNVYRAKAIIDSSQPTELARVNTFAGFARLNAKPLAKPAFVDEQVDLSAAEEKFGYKWAVYGYRVTAVNALGVESGPSPWALTIPEMPAMPEVVEANEGKVTLSWPALPSKAIVGYNVYRLWDRPEGSRTASKINVQPIAGTRYTDESLPGQTMRRYYIEAVDTLGQQGIYSGGAWAFRRAEPARPAGK